MIREEVRKPSVLLPFLLSVSLIGVAYLWPVFYIKLIGYSASTGWEKLLLFGLIAVGWVCGRALMLFPFGSTVVKIHENLHAIPLRRAGIGVRIEYSFIEVQECPWPVVENGYWEAEYLDFLTISPWRYHATHLSPLLFAIPVGIVCVIVTQASPPLALGLYWGMFAIAGPSSSDLESGLIIRELPSASAVRSAWANHRCIEGIA